MKSLHSLVKNQSLPNLARLTFSMISITLLKVNRLPDHSALCLESSQYRFLSLITRTITFSTCQKVRVEAPSATLRASRTISSTRSKCLLSQQLRISVSRRRQVRRLSCCLEMMISLRIISRVCTSVDLQTLERIGSRSAYANGMSFLSSKFFQSKTRSSSNSDLPQRQLRQRLMHLTMRQ